MANDMKCWVCGTHASHSSAIGFMCPSHAGENRSKGVKIYELKGTCYEAPKASEAPADNGDKESE